MDDLDELYTACLLAIGTWAFKPEQSMYLCEVNAMRLGKECSFKEDLEFVQGFRRFCDKRNPPPSSPPLRPDVIDLLRAALTHNMLEKEHPLMRLTPTPDT